ncbi:MAG: hypothetical protein J6A89_05940 [Clostridia bacterium]|nr:hypothetical protein [Clostridia bacterium]
MIIIYDFDGTLTPYSLPQYEILTKNGYTDEIINKRLKSKIQKDNCTVYQAYYATYQEILKENNIEFNRKNVCLGAQNVNLNKGVLEYFKSFQYKETGIKHYIVTSGLQEYIYETPIKNYIQGAYGVTFKENNGIYTELDLLLDDKMKVDIIKKIMEENNNETNIIYFGDGLTDKNAFEFVHSIGGTTVFIAQGENPISKYNKINENGIIDEYFEPDYSKDSKISNYIRNLL